MVEGAGEGKEREMPVYPMFTAETLLMLLIVVTIVAVSSHS